MRAFILLLLLAGCATAVPQPSGEGWRLVPVSGGAWLDHVDSDGRRVATLACAGTLTVNVPSFRPVASEERMSLGAGGIVTALVAQTGGDNVRGGVSADAPVPAELGQILASPAGIRVNYGYQDIGPLPEVPEALSRSFLAACRG